MGEHEAGIALAKGGDPAAALVPEPILKALRDDPVLHKLLGRMSASDPHGGRGVLVLESEFFGPLDKGGCVARRASAAEAKAPCPGSRC